MDGIYAVIKRYEKVNESGQVVVEFKDWFYKPNDYDSIYKKIMELTNNNHILAADAASWCEFASIGGVYETYKWEIEIQEID